MPDLFDFDALDDMAEGTSDEEDGKDTKVSDTSPKEIPDIDAVQLASKDAEPAEPAAPHCTASMLAEAQESASMLAEAEAAVQPSVEKDAKPAEPAASQPTAPRPADPQATAQPSFEDAQLLLFDTLTSAVLYIVQYEVPVTPQEFWDKQGFSTSEDERKTMRPMTREFSNNKDLNSIELGNGRKLFHLPNGICIAQQIDFKKSIEPVRLERTIYQTKAGSDMKAAKTIRTWDSATKKPLLTFSNVWELVPSQDGTRTRVRQTIKDFEQFEKQHIPMGELVIQAVDEDHNRIIRTFLGPQAKLPADYVLFSAPATADLLEAVSVGKPEATLQELLRKRADVNHICDPDDRDTEMTPLTAAVEAGSVTATKLLLEKGQADPNIVCCRNEKASGGESFFTATDVARKVPNGRAREIEQLLRKAGGVPMSKLDKDGSPGGAGNRQASSLEGVDPAAFERAIKDLDRELRLIRRKPAAEQRALFRKLLLQWHPDKNQGREALATSVFQWLQQAALQGHRRNAGGVHWRTGRNMQAETESRQDRRKRRVKRPPRERPRSPKGTPIEPRTDEMTTEMRISARNWLNEFLVVLLDRGQTVHQLDKDGRTAIFYACRGVRNPTGQMQKFPNTGTTPSDDLTGNFKFMSWQDVDMITFIVEDCEGNVNHRDNYGVTPLMEAVRFGCVHTCEILLDANADIHARDAQGNTALDIARLPAPEYCWTNEDEWLTRSAEGMTQNQVDEGKQKIRRYITDDRAKCGRILEQELFSKSLGGGEMKRVAQLRK